MDLLPFGNALLIQCTTHMSLKDDVNPKDDQVASQDAILRSSLRSQAPLPLLRPWGAAQLTEGPSYSLTLSLSNAREIPFADSATSTLRSSSSQLRRYTSVSRPCASIHVSSRPSKSANANASPRTYIDAIPIGVVSHRCCPALYRRCFAPMSLRIDAIHAQIARF